MMQQQVLDFEPVYKLSRISNRSYGGWTPSQWRDTSIQAAESLEPFVANLREKVLMSLTRDPGTNHELEARLGMRLQTVCGRVAELREDELIQDSGRRRSTDSGRAAVVWTPTELGLKVGRALIRAGREFC